MERSLVIIKPDAVSRGLGGAVLNRLEGKGLRLAALKMLHLDKDLARRHYAIHRDKPFFSSLVTYIT
ncbi:MAG: nucleoside-diphosphate kinase, partial [Dehalococcoidales bacterium]